MINKTQDKTKTKSKTQETCRSFQPHSELTGKVGKLWGVGLPSLPAGGQEGGDVLKEHFLEFRNLEYQRIRLGGEDSEVVIEMQREKEKTHDPASTQGLGHGPALQAVIIRQ